MLESFNNAGFSKKAATEIAENGVIFTVPSRHGTVNVRAMEGNSKNYRRSVFKDGKNTKNYRKIGGCIFNGPTPKLNRIIGSRLEQIKLFKTYHAKNNQRRKLEIH